jgi:hypothetical protein
MRVSLYSPEDADDWDALVAAAPMGTFQHTRRFLSYHGARYADQSLVFREPGTTLKAVLPAAISPADPMCVVSHVGATYGGLVFDVRSAADEAWKLLGAACEFLRAQGFSRLVYKPVPPHLHAHVCQADIYAIWRQGGRLIRRDLWNVIDLAADRRIRKTRVRSVRRARESGIQIEEDNSSDAYEAFLEMTTKRLEERYATKPVHSFEEMRMLHERFPERISLWVARNRTGYLAGTWMFDLRPAAFHCQYGHATPAGREVFALDLLFHDMIEHAAARGARYYSFGASTEREGTVLNSGLFAYKSSFGGGSVAHDSYELDLERGG